MPLFPSETSAVCKKAAIVATIEASAVRLQIPTVGPLGKRLCGGHTWRVSGAQALAAAGVPERVVVAWPAGPCDHLAYNVRLEILVGAVLHLACSVTKCLDEEE